MQGVLRPAEAAGPLLSAKASDPNMPRSATFPCLFVRPTKPRLRANAAVAALLLLSPLAQAQPQPPEPAQGLSGRIGLMLATTPTHEGSPNRRTIVAPDLALTYRSREWGTVEFGQRGLSWTAVESGRFRLVLVAQFDAGRKTKDPAALDPTPGDKRLAGLGPVSSSTEAGIGLGVGPVMVVARQSLGDRGAKGAQVDMTLELPWALSDRLSLRAALVATWADRDVMQTHFGVTAVQARATPFPAYSPKSGCRKVEASLGAEFVLAPRWSLQGTLSVTQLGEGAAASPLVARRSATSAAVGVAYAF